MLASLEIDNKVFYDLKQKTIPDEINYLGEYILSGCLSLENVTFPINLNSILVGFLNQYLSKAEFKLSDIFYLITICENYFRNCTSLKEIFIPETVINIEENAFNWCESLINIAISVFMTSINESAFMNCISLQKIDFVNSHLISIEDHYFNCCILLKWKLFFFFYQLQFYSKILSDLKLDDLKILFFSHFHKCKCKNL